MTAKIKKIVVGSLEANCFLVWDETSLEAVIIDPGANGSYLNNEIKTNNLKLKYIINTHGHADHISANSDVKDFNPNAKLVIHEKDADLLLDNNKNLSSLFGQYITSYPADCFIKDEDILEFGNHKIKVMETPGHTLGSVCLILDDESIFTGDTLFYLGVGRTDFPYSCIESMKQSLKKFKNLNKNLKVYSGHGPESRLDFELINNPYLNDNYI